MPETCWKQQKTKEEDYSKVKWNESCCGGILSGINYVTSCVNSHPFIYFIHGHVTQELACVMAAITMAPNVMVKCYDAVGTEAKWSES